MSYRTHKIALNPNNKQRTWFAQQCGYARYSYNWCLAEFKSGLDNDTFLSIYDLRKRFNQHKKILDWTKEQEQEASKNGMINLGQAIANWVSKRGKFPKFKGRGHKQSYTPKTKSVQVENNRIRLPKIGWVKMFEKLRFVGKIIKVTISRTAHRWFVSITIETEDTKPLIPQRTLFLVLMWV